jgi:hypothetical protein
MSVEEFSPIVQELTRNPVAFLGGFAAGILRLNLAEDPVKSWLSQQGVAPDTSATPGTQTGGSASSGPQSIAID